MKSVYIIKNKLGMGYSIIKQDSFDDIITLSSEENYSKVLEYIKTYQKMGYKYLGVKNEVDLI